VQAACCAPPSTPRWARSTTPIQRKLAAALADVLTAIGEGLGTNGLTGDYAANYTLVAPGTVAVAASGASSVVLASGTALQAAAANNVATMAAKWNAVFAQANSYALGVVAG
jgi:hypothetical protein